MLKDKLLKAVSKTNGVSYRADDTLPVGIRGELEVFVRDRDGNLLSYEKGHNQVTNMAKMQIIHLLAGEVGVLDNTIYSTDLAGYEGRKHFTTLKTENSAEVQSTFQPTSDMHSPSINYDGCMVSGEQYFSTQNNPEINQVSLNDIGSASASGKVLRANYPTKMLFGTGMEINQTNGDTGVNQLSSIYTQEVGGNVSNATINKLNGFDANTSITASDFFDGFNDNDKLTNYYSGSNFRARTLQPAITDAQTSTVTAEDTTIKGAIKNCYITSVSTDTAKYDAVSRMAYGKYRGFGLPAYIYAKRITGTQDTLSGFHNPMDEEYVHYSRNMDYDGTLISQSVYETELTYVVNMPAQPANVESIASFYPYNGWVLKEAGLFSDARYVLRSDKDGQESALMNENSVGNSRYNDSVSGMLMFKRNLSSPILKTPDLSITFAWHIYITL